MNDDTDETDLPRLRQFFDEMPGHWPLALRMEVLHADGWTVRQLNALYLSLARGGAP